MDASSASTVKTKPQHSASAAPQSVPANATGTPGAADAAHSLKPHDSHRRKQTSKAPAPAHPAIPAGIAAKTDASATATPAKATPSEPDECMPSAVELDFSSAKVTHNNLGGAGPDQGKEELRFAGIGAFNSQLFDLVVKVVGGKYGKKSGLTGTGGNGISCGGGAEVSLSQAGDTACKTGARFARIAMGAKADKGVEFRFSIEDTKTGQEVVLPGWYITFFDIDQDADEGAAKLVAEQLVVSGYSKAIYDRGASDLEVSEAKGSFTARSRRPGHDCDDPSDPMALKVTKCQKVGNGWNVVDQKKRSVMFAFKDSSNFTVTLSTPCFGCDKADRSFMFGGRSSMVDFCV